MILFFGPPGSGKSVQGQLLVDRNGWEWLSTGQLFRETTDQEILDRMAAGELISDEMTNRLVETALGTREDATHIVLDGYPRNVTQAQWLSNYLPQQNRDIAAIIVFQTPQEELIRRQSERGRVDDTEEVIKRRLEIYEQQTQPVVEFYKKRGVSIAVIDGSGSVEEVHERVQAAAEEHGLTI